MIAKTIVGPYFVAVLAICMSSVVIIALLLDNGLKCSSIDFHGLLNLSFHCYVPYTRVPGNPRFPIRLPDSLFVCV